MTAIANHAAAFMRGDAAILPRLRSASAPWVDLAVGPGPLWCRVMRWSRRNAL